MERILNVHACLHACLLAGANVIHKALGQVIKVTLLENPNCSIVHAVHMCLHSVKAVACFFAHMILLAGANVIDGANVKDGANFISVCVH